MEFGQAIQSGLQHYVGFSGRARRSEYWWFVLFYVIINVSVSVLGSFIHILFALGGLFLLALVIPGIAVTFRRLHDTDRSAWWLLIGLVPLAGAIVLIVFCCQDSTPGNNQYGPSPKHAPPEYGGGAAHWAGGF